MTDLASPAAAGSLATAALPTVVVVDSDDRTRESLVGLLSTNGRLRVVGSAGSVKAALELVRADRPLAVVLDPRLPDLADGLALIRRIHAGGRGPCILAVGREPGFEAAVREAGADAYLRKTFRPNQIADALLACIAARRTTAGASTGPAPVATRSEPPGSDPRR